ncbi:MAG: FliH/SctL family protein [Acidimicrobiia bacterium]|nr:FliH/SctL family protein [Acidimicrobiia bacterium]
MNRVIRNAAIATSPRAYGHGAPVLIDDSMADIIEKARAEAFEAGRREGFAAGQADMAGAAERVQTALANAATDLVRMRSACVEDAIDAAFDVAEFVLGRTPHDDGASLGPRIAEALQAIDDEEIVIAVHPQDWEAVGSAIRLPNGVSIERDPSLRPGEARIDGRWARAELTREAALSIAREVLS